MDTFVFWVGFCTVSIVVYTGFCTYLIRSMIKVNHKIVVAKLDAIMKRLIFEEDDMK